MTNKQYSMSLICGDDRRPEEGCGGSSRRQFLQRAGCAAGALAFGLAIDVWNLPVLEARGERADQTSRYPLPATDSVRIDRSNEVILVRYQGRIYAFGLWCPHQNTALDWLPADHRFQCPKHHSKYTELGVFMSGRATRNMDRYAVSLQGTSVVVDLDTVYRSDKNAAQWKAASVAA
ncbi:MAG TPA: Rieske (2Fe-2S) protein [Vicinamibacterales bacterium]|nr:Rieske (2Fe-2S) protein [Vicinamibacterales bacterium]